MASEIEALIAIVKAIRMVLGTDPARAEALIITGATSEPIRFVEKGTTKMQMTDKQTFTATVKAVDSEGNPASLPTPPVWASSDTSIVLVEASADGMTAVVSTPSPGPLGSAIVTVAAQLGAETLSATLAVDIIGSDATALNIETSEPS